MIRIFRQIPSSICLCLGLVTAASAAPADETIVPALYSALKGRWEGTLAGEFRSQEVSWHFEIDRTGQLKGYMGPSTAGMPSLPMENLSVSGERVSFSIESQHGAFEGAITLDGIAGVWRQGTSLPLQMKKKDFAFPLSDAVRAALLGHWEMNSQTAVHVDFSETEAGLVGVLAVPSLNVREIPLVDIFVTDEGYAQFATDNGRRFTGRLINGVLVGEYSAPGAQQKATFSKPGQAANFALQLAERDRDRLMGRWYTKVFGDDVVLEFSSVENGQLQAQLLFDEGPQRSDPLLEAVVDGENFRYTTFSGRIFTGAFVDDGIAGDYRSNNFPFSVTFTREPP